MPHDIPYDELIEPLAALIKKFLSGEFDYPQFQRQFAPALESYERQVRGRAYSPLGVIADIPRHCRNDLRKYCQEALERLPKEALDRSTREWVDKSLIANDDGYTYFSFFEREGRSRFGTHALFYESPVVHDSFLLSALQGSIAPPTFAYSELLLALRDAGGDELATWVYGTEPDNALAFVNMVWSLGNAYAETYQLRRLEREPAPEGGGSYLMLLPKSKKWMLLHQYDYEQFTIQLHGSREFIEEVAARINAEPVWAWRPPDR